MCIVGSPWSPYNEHHGHIKCWRKKQSPIFNISLHNSPPQSVESELNRSKASCKLSSLLGGKTSHKLWRCHQYVVELFLPSPTQQHLFSLRNPFRGHSLSYQLHGKLSLHNPQSPIVHGSPKYCHCWHEPVHILQTFHIAVMVPSISYNMQLCPIKLVAAALWHGQSTHEAYSRQDWLRNFFEKQLPLKWAMPLTMGAPSPFCCPLATSFSEYSQTETAGDVQNLLTSLTDICKGSRPVWSPPTQ